jgi:hypothetical protein
MPPALSDDWDGVDIDHLIDRSECGAWKDALKYVQFPVSESVSNDGDRHRVDPLSDSSVPVNVSNRPHTDITK